MCFQLGLHRELPLQEQSFLGKGVLNSRRRLFWTSYGNEAYVAYYQIVNPILTN